jgi:hypothetical protein
MACGCRCNDGHMVSDRVCVKWGTACVSRLGAGLLHLCAGLLHLCAGLLHLCAGLLHAFCRSGGRLMLCRAADEWPHAADVIGGGVGLQPAGLIAMPLASRTDIAC